jgi:hypothetical protein
MRTFPVYLASLALKEALKSAPGFDKDHSPNMADLNWANGVFKFYGTKPYCD